MAESTYLGDSFMQHEFGLSSYSAPGTVYLALHIATTFASAVTSGDGTIDVNETVTQGQRLVLEPLQSVSETHYAGTVTDNGDGTYTVDLVDSGGSSTTAANAHDSGDYVKFDPAKGGSGILEPSGGDYARVSITNDGTEWSFSSPVISNDNPQTFAYPTADWGLVTHALLMDASSGGNLHFTRELSTPEEILSGDPALEFAAGDLEFKH